MIAFLQAKSQNYGLIDQEIGHVDGYVLFAPLESKTTYLIDKCGNLVHSWQSAYKPGQSVYLLENGDLLRTGNDSNTAFISGAGRIEKFDWQNNLKWSYTISNSLSCLHHDIYPMPNGNVLAILWEKKTKEEAIAAGRNPLLVGKYVWNEKIIELKPKGKQDAEIVWYWDVWEHLIQDFDKSLPHYGKIEEYPGRININYNASINEDWLHFNAVSYNETLNEVLISNRNFNEIFIVKHFEKNKNQNNEGAEIIFRWGNVKAYQPTSNTKQHLYLQHSPIWISKGLKDEGKIMLFNNGLGRTPTIYSSVEIINPLRDKNGSYQLDQNLKPEWMYVDTSANTFYSKNVSNAQVINKGHIIICEGATGRFFEIDERKNVMWQYINPIGSKGLIKAGIKDETNRVFRCSFYAKNYKAFKRKKMKAGQRLFPEQSNNSCIPGGV